MDFSGPDSRVLLDLARQTIELLKRIRGATDVNIEQEGPQPQLLIQPDRTLCARYNVRIEDVMKLVNMAIGGEPVSTVYEGERRFDIVARLDKQSRKSPQAIGRLPVYTSDGVPIPLAQVASIGVRDGQTLIARGDGRRRLTVRCDIVGCDQGSFVREAQERFNREITLPPGYRVEWLGMFENLERAYKHFLVLIPTTIAIIFLILVVAYGSFRAAFVLLLPIPFAFASGAVALYLRHMNLNVSTGVGFATLFGVAIMDGILMFKGVSKYRLEGASVDDAIIRGRTDRLRSGLMASLVPILGLLPAALATGLGSDVQRPLATVITCGLTAPRSSRCSSRRSSIAFSCRRCPSRRLLMPTRPNSPSPCPTHPLSKSSGCWSTCTGTATKMPSPASPPTRIGSSPTSSSSSKPPRCWALPARRCTWWS